MSIWNWIFNRRKVQGTEIEGAPRPLPPGSGWRLWQYASDEDMLALYTADQVEVWRENWNEPVRTSVRLMDQRMNIVGLWWRPVP